MDYNLISLLVLEWGLITLLLSVAIYLLFTTKKWIKDTMLLSLFIMFFGLITLLGNKGIELSLFNNSNYNGLMIFTKTSVYNELQRTFTGGEPLQDIKLANNTYIVFDCE